MNGQEPDSRPGRGPGPGQKKSERLTKYREELLKLLILGFPLLLINRAFGWLADRLTGQPWQVLWLLVPVAGVAWILWRIARGRREFRLRGPFLAFFAVYVLIFSVGAGSRLLDWKRTIVGYERQAPRNWLGLSWLGDWRYRFVPPAPAAPGDLVVVTLPSPEKVTLDEVRLQLAGLVKLAADNDARGIGMDFYFDDESRIDPLLCHTIESADFPVVVGYTFDRFDGEILRREFPASLEGCLSPESDQGHLVGFAEADNVVRSIPLFFRGDRRMEAFSLKLARQLALDRDLAVPRNGLLQFVESEREFPRVSYDALKTRTESHRMLADRFVLIGEDSEGEMFPTPFGERLGVLVHASAAHSLRVRHFITRAPWWSSFLVIFVACYVLISFAARGAPTLRLFGVTAAFAAGILGASLGAIFFWRLWIDIAYVWAAIWLLLPLVLGFRRGLTGARDTEPRT